MKRVIHWLKVTFPPLLYLLVIPIFNTAQTLRVKVKETSAVVIAPKMVKGHLRFLTTFPQSSSYHSNFHCWFLSPGVHGRICASERPSAVR